MCKIIAPLFAPLLSFELSLLQVKSNNMGTIRFELRKEKIDKQGKSPIRLIYQIKGQRKYFNTGLKTLPACWDDHNQQTIYVEKRAAKKLTPTIDYSLFFTDKEVKKLNNDLSDLIKTIAAIEQRFELDRIVYSAEMVTDKLKASKHPVTKKDDSSKVLFDFIDRYIQDNASTREEGSLQVYRSLKTHLHDFQKQVKRRITFDSIDYKFFQDFQTFLITDTGTTTNRKGETVQRKALSNSTAGKQLSTIKTFLNYAKKHGIEVSDKYREFTIKRDSLEVIALTNREFESIYYLDLFKNKKLCQVRDVFCLGCTTGLRYSDLAQLRREHIKEDEIKLTVTKTKQPLTIPLTPFSKSILAKYNHQLKPLPIISNQKMNDYVKDLCKLAGIVDPVEIVRFKGTKREAVTYPKYELIGSHTGRKTFATLSLEKGMSAEQVMAIGGWKDYKSFKRYVNVTDTLKRTVMLKAWGGVLSDVKLKVM